MRERQGFRNILTINVRLLRISTVCEITSLSRATIYRLVAEGRFPKPTRLSTNRIAWRERSVADWVASRA